METLNTEATLREIVSKSKSAGELLVSIGLDVSGQSGKTLRQVCSEKQLNEDEVLHWLKKNHLQQTKLSENRIEKEEQSKIPITEQCNRMIRESHPVIRDLLSETSKNYHKIRKEGEEEKTYVWLADSAHLLQSFRSSLALFLKFEKEKFFPLAKELEARKEKTMDGDVQSLNRSVDLVEHDHVRLRQLMNRIRTASGNFCFDEKACATMRILCRQFMELFEKFDEHIKTEKEKLLPEIRSQLRDI